ncbi:hypothetical protein BH09SUM1_BH09SUM1_01190 [soil metagenome]
MRVDCFEDAPSEWTRKTISDLAVINPRYDLAKGREYPFLEMASVREAFGGVSEFAPRLLDGSNLARYRKDDILFAKITPCAENGKVALVGALPDGEEHGLGSTEFIVLSPKEGKSPEYLFALASSGAFHHRAISRMEGSTGRLRITNDVFTKWLLVAVPEDDEQAAIIAVLRAADEAIAKTKVELDAARRVKTALMQRVFREGLEPTERTQLTKYEPAPLHWQPVRVGEVTDVSAGVTLNQDRNPSSNAFRYLTVVNVQRGYISLDEERYLELRPSEVPGKLLEKDDVVVVEGHANTMEIGRAAIITEECAGFTYQNHLFRARLKPDADMEPRFLLLALNEERVRRHWNAICNTSSGLNTLNRRQLRRLEIFAPTGEEQREVVRRVDAAEATIAAVADKVTALERLKKSLMQDLLTGKVRVKPKAAHVVDGASHV